MKRNWKSNTRKVHGEYQHWSTTGPVCIFKDIKQRNVCKILSWIWRDCSLKWGKASYSGALLCLSVGPSESHNKNADRKHGAFELHWHSFSEVVGCFETSRLKGCDWPCGWSIEHPLVRDFKFLMHQCCSLVGVLPYLTLSLFSTVWESTDAEAWLTTIVWTR